MSKTVYSRTGVSSVRGRGRAQHHESERGHHQQHRHLGIHGVALPTVRDEQEEFRRPENTESCKKTVLDSEAESKERTLQSHGAHHMLSPDSSKHTKLKSTAEQETKQYERLKKEKRERATDLLTQQRPAAVGGLRYSKTDMKEMRIRQEKQQQIEAKYAGVRSRQKRADYREQERQREEEELQKKMKLQREKAIKLEEKKRAQQQADLDHTRRSRLAYFDNPQS